MSTDGQEATGSWVRGASKQRFGVLAAIFVLFLVAYSDRSNVTILVTDRAFTDTYGITGNHAAQGLLMSVFLFVYGLANFVTGWLTDRLGARRTLLIAVVGWAVLMAVMPLTSLLVAFLILRGLLGVSESPMTPATDRLIQRWMPPHERQRANATWVIGLTLAPVITLPLIAWVVLTLGWRASFYLLAAIGLVVPAFFVLYFVRDRPGGLAEDQREDGAPAAVPSPRPTGRPGVFARPDYWALLVAYAMAVGFLWGLTTWFPSYVHESLHRPFLSTGFYSAVPWLAVVVVAVAVSSVLDRFRRATWLIPLSLGLSAVLMMLASVSRGAVTIVVLLALALGIEQITVFVSHTALQRMCAGSSIATAGGVLNGVAYLWSAAVPIVVGVLVDTTGSYVVGFVFLLCTVALGAVAGVPVYLRERREVPIGGVATSSELAARNSQ